MFRGSDKNIESKLNNTEAVEQELVCKLQLFRKKEYEIGMSLSFCAMQT